MIKREAKMLSLTKRVLIMAPQHHKAVKTCIRSWKIMQKRLTIVRFYTKAISVNIAAMLAKMHQNGSQNGAKMALLESSWHQVAQVGATWPILARTQAPKHL